MLFALVHAGLNDADATLGALAKAFEERDPFFPWVRMMVTFQRFQSHPPFVRLMSQTPFPPS